MNKEQALKNLNNEGCAGGVYSWEPKPACGRPVTHIVCSGVYAIGWCGHVDCFEDAYDAAECEFDNIPRNESFITLEDYIIWS